MLARPKNRSLHEVNEDFQGKRNNVIHLMQLFSHSLLDLE